MFAALILLLPSALRAQVAPPATLNPGAIQNQQQRQFQQFQQQQQPPAPPENPVTGGPGPGPRVALPPGVTFLLKGVTFDKSVFLSQQELDAIAKPYIGHDVDFAKLQELIGTINDLYQKKGIITASAVLPPQRIVDGVVRISLVEGKLGKAVPQGNAYISNGFILNRVPLEPGTVVDVPRLTSDLNYFNLINDVRLRAVLQPGAAFGQTDVQLAVQEPPRNVLDIFGDNQGVDSTDRNEGGAFFRRNTTLFDDDLTTLYMTGATGSINGNASYSIPVGTLGGRLGVSYDRNTISVNNGPFRALNITGTSQSIAANFTHPLWTWDSWLVLGNLSVSDTISRSEQATFLVSHTSTYKGTAGFTVSKTTQDYSVSITQSLSLADSNDRILDQSRYLRILTGNATAAVPLWHDFSAAFLAGWQYSPQKLLPSDQLFQIGGPTSVRGYQADIVAGDDGYYGQFELHHPLNFITNGLDAFAFVDDGTVFSTHPTNTTATSTGVGLNWDINRWATASVIGAFPTAFIVSTQPTTRVYVRLVLHLL